MNIKVPKHRASMALTLLFCLIALSHASVDVFWNQIDAHLRQNAPDPDIKAAIQDAELVQVVPTTDFIRFTYLLSSGEEMKVKFSMNEAG